MWQAMPKKPKINYHSSVQPFIRTVGAREFAEREIVSLLGIEGIGKSCLRALWLTKITTASALPETETEAMVEKIRIHIGGVQPAGIEHWKDQIRGLLLERKGMHVGPLGWTDTP